MASFGQFAATSQFYLYGRKNCTATGYTASMKQYLKGGKVDILADPTLSDMSGKVCVVTGGNSGVGFEVAQFLAARGGDVTIVCRSAGRAEEARQTMANAAPEGVPGKVSVLLCDCSLEADVRRAWNEWAAGRASSGGGPPQLDVLVCNAGVLLNERTLTPEGVETTLACHLLFGTYLLASMAQPALAATPQSRLIVVSSGGMYNTKWPSFNVAASCSPEEAAYDGNMAYAYCKRGQVLLCEEWAKAMPTSKVVTCHPGWTLTPAVDAAYGDQKKYLEPLRTPWQGADGIAWLCAAPFDSLESGAFYLDRVPRAKHMAGPFFSEGSFTKNSSDEVAALMSDLALWSAAATRPPTPTNEEFAQRKTEADARKVKLVESPEPIDVKSFMGRWFVIANVPTYFEVGMVNCIEDYTWNDKKGCIDVVFSMQAKPDAKPSVLLQRAAVTNKATGTKWAISPKVGVYLPLSLTYLVVACASDYSTCVVAVPDRAYLWVMARTPTVDDAVLEALLARAEVLGYDRGKVQLVTHDYSLLDGGVPPQPAACEEAGREGPPEGTAATERGAAAAEK